MNAWHRFGRLGLLAAFLVLTGMTFGCDRTANQDRQADTAIEAGAKPAPGQVQLIRHAEKSGDDIDIHLNSRGAARAAALPSLFVIPPTFPTTPAPFTTPDFLLATKESKHSNRPVETVTPLARVLGNLSIHHKHADKDYQEVVNDLFREAKYAGKIVLICWHHGKLPDLAHAIAAKAKNADKLKNEIPERWDGSMFDRVWLFTFDDKGEATFANRPQQLLFRDSKK